MNSFVPFDENDDIFAKLSAYFESLRFSPFFVLMPPPSTAGLYALANAAFSASLLFEEGQQTRVSIAWQKYSPANRHRGTDDLKFAKPIALDARSIAKIAPIARRRNFAIGVSRLAGEKLYIWGLTRILLFTLEIEVVDPGYVVIRHVERNVGVFDAERGATFLGRPGRMDFIPQVQALLSNGPVLNEEMELAAWRVSQICRTMLRLGRGGTLLIVPSSSTKWRTNIQQPITYALDPRYDCLSRLDEYNTILEQEVRKHGYSESDRLDLHSEKQGAQDDIKREVERLADLTTVDGALIVDESLNVIGFGAKIIAKKSRGVSLEILKFDMMVGGKGKRIALDALGGTRHQSAANFVLNHNDCLAIVASQDKRLTLITWDKDQSIVRANRVDYLVR